MDIKKADSKGRVSGFDPTTFYRVEVDAAGLITLTPVKYFSEAELQGHWSNGDPTHIITDGVNRRVAPNHNGAKWEGSSEPILDTCKAYEAGLLKRSDLVRTLVSYEYAPTGETDGYDSLLMAKPGEWSEVETAVRRGHIDQSIYEEVFNLRHGVQGAAEEAEMLLNQAMAKKNGSL